MACDAVVPLACISAITGASAIARAVVHDDNEAEDVVQEAYMRAFASLADFRGESTLATWLSPIVLNEALRRIRRPRPTVNMTSVDTRQPSQSEVIQFPLALAQLDPERTMAQRQIQMPSGRAGRRFAPYRGRILAKTARMKLSSRRRRGTVS